MPRDLAELLEQRRTRDADLRSARYVRPEGGGQHRVELIPGDDEVLVGSLVGGHTFRPGALVVLGTFAGGRQRAIVGLAPPGHQGASSFPVERTETELRAGPTLLAAVPEVVLAGQTDQIVYLVGLGLSEDPPDTFEAVVGAPGAWSADPYVVIREPEWVADPEAVGVSVGPGQSVVKVLVDVAASGPEGYPAGLRLSRAK